MNNDNRNDKSKTPQGNPQTGKDPATQGKDARPASDSRAPTQANAGKDAKGTESPSKS
ncbi:MAG TPA: hypothetical protein VFM73_07320 [Xanthomonadaceae bacterium]|nr:hypothetical protein [Xanthomonadaceae bacterium]